MPDEAPASLLADLDTAQRALASQLTELRGADSQHLHMDMLAVGGAKLLQLSRLRDQLVSGAKDVTVLRAAVASAVADSRAYASEARSAVSAAQAGTGEQSANVALTAASEAARTATNGFMDDYYKRHNFDDYLIFASKQDAEEYHRREAERQAAIEKALAAHTPEGDLLASRLSLEQLKDAGAHGANRSPQYEPLLHHLESAGDNLAARIGAANGTSTKRERESAASASPATDNTPQNADLSSAIARLRTPVALADSTQDGHGLPIAATRLSATPDLPSH